MNKLEFTFSATIPIQLLAFNTEERQFEDRVLQLQAIISFTRHENVIL